MLWARRGTQKPAGVSGFPHQWPQSGQVEHPIRLSGRGKKELKEEYDLLEKSLRERNPDPEEALKDVKKRVYFLLDDKCAAPAAGKV